MKFIKLGIISILTASTLFAGTYDIDPVHSNVGFKIRHMMIAYVNGKFDKFSGIFVYDEKTKALKSLEGTVFVNSINTQNSDRDADLRSVNFFDTAKYPKMHMKITKIADDIAYGDLTIHGITKKVKMNLETSGVVVKDPWGNTKTGLNLSFKINRQDFGLKWNKLLETGGVIVGDKVKVNIDIEGVLKK